MPVFLYSHSFLLDAYGTLDLTTPRVGRRLHPV
jgi:hypothetical protein